MIGESSPPQSSTLTIMVCSTYHSSNFLQNVVTERMCVCVCVCAIIKLCILFGGTHLLVVPWEVVWGSTCGSHGHSHHRIGAGHHSLRYHRSDTTYTQCTASDRCARFEPKTQKIAYKMDELRRKRGREREIKDKYSYRWQKKLITLTWSSTVSAGDHFLWLFCLIVHVVLSKTEVTVRIRLRIFFPNEIRRRGEGHRDTSLTGDASFAGRAWERRCGRRPSSGGGGLSTMVLRTVGLQRGSRLVATITSWRGNNKKLSKA